MFYRKHVRVTTPVGELSMTKQSHKDECDINKILSQYKKTGLISHISNNQPQFMDLPSDIDYQSSLNIMLRAEDAFAALPSLVRDHFANDPERFLRAFGDASQRPYLEELGLLKPAPPPAAAAPAAKSKAGGAPAVEASE